MMLLGSQSYRADNLAESSVIINTAFHSTRSWRMIRTTYYHRRSPNISESGTVGTGGTQRTEFQYDQIYQIVFRKPAMPKIALIVGNLGNSKAEAVKSIRTYLGLEVSKIFELAGSRQPLLVRKLFDRSEPKFTSSLQVVLADL